jgi:Mg2+-importing ATPase
LIVFVVRSSKPLFNSKPGKWLSLTTLTIVSITVALPYTPISTLAGFQPLPIMLLGQLAGIVVLYIMTAELAKHIFYRHIRI